MFKLASLWGLLKTSDWGCGKRFVFGALSSTRLRPSLSYDFVVSPRNIKGFMVQGGDPSGTGKGGDSIYTNAEGKKHFPDEIVASLKVRCVPCVRVCLLLVMYSSYRTETCKRALKCSTTEEGFYLWRTR